MNLGMATAKPPQIGPPMPDGCVLRISRPFGKLPEWVMAFEQWAFEHEVDIKILAHWASHQASNTVSYTEVRVMNPEHRTLVLLKWGGQVVNGK